ncbi:MAG: DUF4835 family protein [Bacteroidota bacterium]|nr:DUF4835 family protein [Bacteroidota bacterium]
MRTFILVILFSLSIFLSKAQELLCNIQVNHSQIQGTNIQVFQELQKDLYEFMNNRQWTNNVFSNNERIECRIMINLTKYDGIDKYTGTITVQAVRPIFNTNYNSVLINHKEKDNLFEFEYTEGQRLEFNENTHLSNITSVMAFYAYLIIGLDYDSFGTMSGTPYFTKAQQIVSNAQSGTSPGWKAYESSDRTNRYYLAESFLDNDNAPLRRFYYSYHRLGLDVMSGDAMRGRAEITKAVRLLERTHNNDPDSYLLKILLTTKEDEIVKVYSEATIPEKKKVYNILKDIDPTSDKLNKIME